VGQGLYRCYRETCVYRDNKGLVSGDLPRKVCYVCGRVGETHDRIGDYRGVPIFRCENNMFCQLKLIRGIKVVYTDQGVYKYIKGKEGQLSSLTQPELEELKQEELKERLQQIADKKYKPTLIEFITLALQEKYYTIEELANKFKANLSTVKSTVPYQIKKQGFNVVTKYSENKVLMYKVEIPKAEGTQQAIKPSQSLKKEVGVEVIDSREPSDNNPNHHVENCKCEYCVEARETEKPKVKKPYVMTIPKSGAVFNMFELLKTGEFTMLELVEKAQVSISTVKMQLAYHIKNKTMNIVINGDKYGIK